MAVQRVATLVFLTCVVLGCTGLAAPDRPPVPPPAPRVPPPPPPDAPPPAPPHAPPPAPRAGSPLTIQLVDGRSRAILAGVSASIVSDNGIRCVRAPCPTNQRTWEGRADAEGGVHVPADIVDEVMTITVAGYRPATVRQDAYKRPKRMITLRLLPE